MELQKERGADVAEELEEARESVLNLAAKALADIGEDARGRVQNGEQANLPLKENE